MHKTIEKIELYNNSEPISMVLLEIYWSNRNYGVFQEIDRLIQKFPDFHVLVEFEPGFLSAQFKSVYHHIIKFVNFLKKNGWEWGEQAEPLNLKKEEKCMNTFAHFVN